MAKKKTDDEAPLEFVDDAPEGAAIELDAIRAENADLRRRLDLALAALPPNEKPGVGTTLFAPPAGDRALPLWRVTLACPTPLTYQTLEVRAADAHQAKMEYCRRNGISDSRHTWRIDRIEG